jgi:catechol 2,3-dioxygenase-like lactoylglutathione lyase family enzyme
VRVLRAHAKGGLSTREEHLDGADRVASDRAMIGHLSFGVADLSRSTAFYDAVLAPLGAVRVWTAQDGAGYGPLGGADVLALKLQAGRASPPGPGFHLAFDAPSREAVEAFHTAALAQGGRDAGGPGLRPHYGEAYYAAFVIDPDGHKLEAVSQRPPDDRRARP